MPDYKFFNGSETKKWEKITIGIAWVVIMVHGNTVSWERSWRNSRRQYIGGLLPSINQTEGGHEDDILDSQLSLIMREDEISEEKEKDDVVLDRKLNVDGENQERQEVMAESQSFDYYGDSQTTIRSQILLWWKRSDFFSCRFYETLVLNPWCRMEWKIIYRKIVNEVNN